MVLTYTVVAPEASAGLGPILFFPSQTYNQRNSLYRRRELTVWEGMADDGEEGTQLHSLPMFM